MSNTKTGTQFKTALSLLAALALAAALVTGCSKEKKADEGAPAGNSPSAAVDTGSTLGDSDSGKAAGLQTVNFAYDSFALTAEGKGKLKTNAQTLKDNAGLKIQVEGHCDVRGGIQYNLALGEKRANAVKKYLQDMGIAAERITTISYGKERLLDQGTADDAHAKNRRANFVITAK